MPCGANSARSIKTANDSQTLGLDPEVLLRGFRDGLSGGKLTLTDEQIDETLHAFQTMIADRNAKEGEDFLAANKRKPGVKELGSGLQVKVLKKGNGSGKKPTINDNVTVQYRGRLINGKEFDSSYDDNQPITMPVTGFIPGWVERTQLMEVGSKWELYIPADLAYGPTGPEKIGPNSTLIFEIELVDVPKSNSLGRPGQTPLPPPKGRAAEDLKNYSATAGCKPGGAVGCRNR